MPRQARIDAPGALHHIIARGIAQKKVFNDDADMDFFIDKNLIWSNEKQPKVVQARSLLCYWATSELGTSKAALSKRLGLSPPAVSISVSRGRNLAQKSI